MEIVLKWVIVPSIYGWQSPTIVIGDSVLKINITRRLFQTANSSLLLSEETFMFSWSRSFSNNSFRVFPECNITINGVILRGSSPKAKRISLLHKRIVSSIRKETFGTMCSCIDILEHLDALPSPWILK